MGTNNLTETSARCGSNDFQIYDGKLGCKFNGLQDDSCLVKMGNIWLCTWHKMVGHTSKGITIITCCLVRVNSIKVDGGIFHEVVRYSIPVNVALSRIKVTPVCRIWSHNTYSMLEQSNILDDKQNLTGSGTCLYKRVSYEKII